MNGHLFVITLNNVLLLGALFIGLAFALLLWLIKGPEQKANLFLGLGLVVLCACLLPSGPFQFSLALGPLLIFLSDSWRRRIGKRATRIYFISFLC